MSLRCRTFLIADDGTLYRLANAKFDRMRITLKVTVDFA